MVQLTLNEIIRYVLSGVVITAAILITFSQSLPETYTYAISWLETHDKLINIFSTSASFIIIFLVGYFTFFIYRGLVYGIFIVWFKGIVYKRSWSYRDLIKGIASRQCGKKISGIAAERIYGLAKLSSMLKVPVEKHEIAISGGHLLYFTSVYFFVFGVIRLMLFCDTLSVIMICAAAVLFAIELLIDHEYEKMELLMFNEIIPDLERRIKDFLPNGERCS